MHRPLVRGAAAKTLALCLLWFLIGGCSDDDPVVPETACSEIEMCEDYSQYARTVSRHRFAGSPLSIACQGDLAYIGTNNFAQSLVILDYTVPHAPTVLSELSVGNYCRDIVVAGGLAYIVEPDRGLVIVDVSDASSPSIVSMTELSYDPQALELVDGMIAVIGSGLALFDVSDPQTPQVIGETPDISGVSLVASEAGDHLFVGGNYEGLLTVDVSDPSSPVLVSQIYPLSRTWNVALSGSTLFVVDLYSGILVYDVADPGSPRVLAYERKGYGSEIVIYGDWVGYAAPTGVSSFEGLTFATWTESSGLEPIAQIPVRGGLSGIGIVGDHAVVISGGAASAVTILDTGVARVAHETDAPWGGTLGEAVALGDDFALVIGPQGLQLIDVSCSTSPSVVKALAEVPYPATMAGHGNIVAVTTRQSEVAWFDVSNPRVPYFQGEITLDGECWSLALSGTHGYFGVSDQIQVVDYSDIDAPSVTTTISGASGAVLVFDDYLAVGGTEDLKIFSLQNPSTPQQAAVLEFGDWFYARKLCRVGDYLLVARTGGLKIVDVSAPATPVVAAQLEFAEKIIDVCQIDGYAYVVEEGIGVHVVDLDDPTTPRIVGFILPGNITRAIPMNSQLWLDLSGRLGVTPPQCP